VDSSPKALTVSSEGAATAHKAVDQDLSIARDYRTDHYYPAGGHRSNMGEAHTVARDGDIIFIECDYAGFNSPMKSATRCSRRVSARRVYSSFVARQQCPPKRCLVHKALRRLAHQTQGAFGDQSACGAAFARFV
jgi:hypothetical protein